MGTSTINQILRRSTFGILILIAFVFGIKQLREPDILWQLRTGEWIIQNNKVMNTDIFSFTFNGVPWMNVKWGFELLLFWLFKFGNVAFTPVLQSIASVLLVIIFWKQFKFLYSWLSGNKVISPGVGFLITAILFLVATAYRMNGRPEMTSHVLAAFFLLILFNYWIKPSNWVFILVPLEMVWSNMHEAYGTGEVIILVMLSASWLEYFYKRKANLAVPLKLTLTAVLAIAATALGPYGFKMILHPLDIFNQVSENKFTTELFSFTTREYWQKEAWLNIFFFILSVFGLFLPYKKLGELHANTELKWYKRPFYSFGLGYIILLILFFYLSLTAYRNIIFFILVSAPVTASTISFLLGYFKSKIARFSKPYFITGIYSILLIISILFYLSIPSNWYYAKAENQNNHYGLRIDPLMNPIGAAQYLKDNHISGTCFSDFLISNYLLWELRPDFKTFIDLRDLDVFPASFFKDFALITKFPQKLDQVDSLYHFNYAVLYRNNFQNIHSYFYNNKNWVMVYADPVSIVFLKRNLENSSLILKSKNMYPDNDIFTPPVEKSPSKIAGIFTNIFWPGAEINYNLNTDYNLIAASYYLSVGNSELALKRSKIALDKNTAGSSAFMGDIYLYKYNNDTVASKKAYELAQAENFYTQANDKDKKNVKAIIGLARVEMMKNDFEGALSYIKKSIKLDPSIKDVYILLANCLNRLTPDTKEKQDEFSRLRIEAMEKAFSLDPNDLTLKFYLGLNYGHTGDCDKAVDYLKQTMNYPGIPPQDLKEARKILLQCGN